MKHQMTVGEKVDRDGYCLVFVRIAELAKAVGRIPAGEWAYRFTTDPRWRFWLNGGKQDRWTLPNGTELSRFEAYIEYDGTPLGFVNAAGGTMLWGAEDTTLAALEDELAAVRKNTEVSDVD